ncbi:MAG TPA: aminodeoxychorismate lyase [Mycobacteriales bacterium]|nr:aminodeoxychorismate lyase [Mycobacteriales bacterium]
MTLWVNGSIAQASDPVLRADDHGFTVGDGVFETMKLIDGRPFALTRHLRRLQSSADGLGIALDLAVVRAALAQVIALEQAPLARLRVTVTAGSAPFGTDRGEGGPTLIVATSPLADWPASADVSIVPWTRNERAATVGLKTTSYADNVIALRHAHARGAGEAIFANTIGELCEGTGSNIFIGRAGTLLTPALSSGCLPGITRELVIEWLGDVVERPLPITALSDCDEAFLTSSTRDIQPIRTVDGIALPGVPGPLTRRASEIFSERSAELDP